ncbi:MAG: acyl-CoA dehydrogenase [Variovorax sp.]|nr:MAG: acyl-CoA dehydrogenase [Variovorax sp.]
MLAPVSKDALTRLQAAHGDALSLGHLVEAGLDLLPHPGAGQTLARWQRLAAVAAHDLSLVKFFEGHTDALAILAELKGPTPEPGTRWGTWCAEPPDARVQLLAQPDGRLLLEGTKTWCSGAASVTHAVVSGWDETGQPGLAAVALDQPGVTVTDEGWLAVGMARSGSVNVRFERAEATRIGGPGSYTSRPGFWQGGAGIAACWYGGAAGIAQQTRSLAGAQPDAHRLAHLGAIDVALAGAAAVLRESAAWIDAHPAQDASAVALRARLVVEQAAQHVMQHAGRALGAGPLCRNARFATAMADLPVFLRQSHAERDLAALGERARNLEVAPWTL